MHSFLSRLCWPLLKVHFAGHAHVKLVLAVGMWVTGYELSTRGAAGKFVDRNKPATALWEFCKSASRLNNQVINLLMEWLLLKISNTAVEGR